MKGLIKRILTYFRVRGLKKKLISGKNCIFQYHSAVTLLRGSTKEDVVLGDRVIMEGHLISSYNGKIEMKDFSKIGEKSKVLCVNKVVIGEYSAIAENVTICDNNNHPVNPLDRMIMRKTLPGSVERSWIYSDNAPIIIGTNCWIGANSRICKGVTIGDGRVVAANSVVTKDVPANCIVAGNPAKVVKTDIDKLPRYFEDR